MNVYIRTDTPGTVTETYTISNIPTNDSNVYVNVAKSGYIIQSVKFNFTGTGSGGLYVHISSNNSNSDRYGLAEGISSYVRGRLSGASDTQYRTVSFNTGSSNVIEFYVNRNGNCYYTVNGTKTEYSAGTAELNVIQTIMNLSNMNVYASQNGSLITNNKVDVTVTYTPNS